MITNRACRRRSNPSRPADPPESPALLAFSYANPSFSRLNTGAPPWSMGLRGPGLPKITLRKWLKINARPFRRIVEKEKFSAKPLVKLRSRRYRPNATSQSPRV